MFAEDHLGDDRLDGVVTYACAGAVTYNIYDVTDAADSDRPSHVATTDRLDIANYEPRQGESLAKEVGVDMVTVTIGGNDTGFAEVLRECMAGRCDQTTLDAQESLTSVGARIEKMLEQVRLAAPGASVFVLGYPYLTPTFVPITCKSLRPDNLLAELGVDPIAIELLYQALYEFEPAAREALYDAIAALYLTGARLTNQVQTTIGALRTAATEFARAVEDAAQDVIQMKLATLVSAAVAFSGAVRASVSEAMAGVGEAALADAEAQQATAEALADTVGALDTLYGNGGDDTIIGGAGNDTLYGGDATRIGALDGNDIILGAAGDDTIYGNRGPDAIVGGAGDDAIVGGGENDILWGGPGTDDLDGHAGNDTIHAGTGNDSLRGGNGDDTLWGNDGNDTITAGAGDDTVWGGPGNDTLWGNTQNDTLWGGPGDDTIWGQGHNDRLHGGPGDDTLNSGAGDDTAHGNAGDDTLDGGNGTDYLNGGTGNDTCTRGHTTTDCEPQTANRGTS